MITYCHNAAACLTPSSDRNPDLGTALADLLDQSRQSTPAVDTFASHIGALSGIVFGAAWLALIATRSTLSTLVSNSILYLGLVGFLTVNFFVGDYGFLQGEEPDWAKGATQGSVEIIVFLGLIVLFTIFRKKVVDNLNFIAWVVIISALAFFPTVVQDRKSKAYTFSDNGIYELSQHTNVLVFVLDTVQADVANEYFHENDQLREKYSGFEFFRNTTSAFPRPMRQSHRS